MRKMRLGELSAYVTGGSDGQGGGNGPLCVLLHGFGAPGSDLVPLASELALPSAVRFVFPMAPLLLEPGAPEQFAARAWWLIDIAALQVAALTGEFAAISQHEPEGLESARQLLLGLLDAAERELAVPEGQLVIGGFSQGAMLATDVVLASERPFAGLAILSGMLLRSAVWTERAPRRRGLPVFQSHGSADPIVPFPLAERLAQTLRAGGAELEWLAFPGGHGIPPMALQGLAAFLARTLEVER